jgi:hypothetical protein
MNRSISKITGIKIVLVDALNDSAMSFYKAYGFEELDDDKMRLFISINNLISSN